MITLLHGDCLELMKTIPDKSVDMCLTDPPYGGLIDVDDWDIIIPFQPMWDQLKRVVKDNGAICLFGKEPFSSHLRLSNVESFKYDWIWEKTMSGNFANSKKMPNIKYEKISVFYAQLPLYNPQMTLGAYYNDTRLNNTRIISKQYNRNVPPQTSRETNERYPIGIIKFSNPNSNLVHPTQKPVPLLEYLIKTYTLENETVLDFTMGSGSTGVACINLNRNFIGIEKNDKYFDIAQTRINSVNEQPKMKALFA